MSDERPSARVARVPPSVAHACVKAILEAIRVFSDHASTVADCLVAADLRGVDTYGVDRIVSYVARTRQGVLDPTAKPELKETTLVVAQIHGKNGFRSVAANLGMVKAVDMAEIYVVGMVSMENSTTLLCRHGGPTGFGCRSRVSRIHQLFSGVLYKRNVKAHEGLTYRLWSSR